MSFTNSIAATKAKFTPAPPVKLDDSAARMRVFGTLRFLLGLSLVGIGVYLQGSLKDIGLALLIAVGVAVCGAFLGFLFGIPRARQNAGNDGSYQPNTNLEQVSDWLTKIIIGVSLVEMQDIGMAVNELIARLEGGFTLMNPYPFVWALIISYFFYGLLGGYLITRVYLPVMFAKADLGVLDETRAQEIAQDTAERVIKDISERNAEAIRLAQFQLSIGPVTIPIDEDELKRAIHVATQNVKSDIYFTARKFRLDLEHGTPEDRAQLTRALPVFDALIADDEASNTEPQFHSNYAQRAFVLLHALPPDYENAKRALDKAIEVRDRLKEKDHKHYELCRAIANIGSWKFRANDTASLHEAVHADLRSAVPALKTIYNNEHRVWIEEWILAKGITDIQIDKGVDKNL